jgi:hypothetical protein
MNIDMIARYGILDRVHSETIGFSPSPFWEKAGMRERRLFNVSFWTGSR